MVHTFSNLRPLPPVTDRQIEILGFISRHIAVFGFAPTIREIQGEFQIGTLRGVTCHLDALERKGYIERETKTPRAMRVLRNGEGKKVELAYVVTDEVTA